MVEELFETVGLLLVPFSCIFTTIVWFHYCILIMNFKIHEKKNLKTCTMYFFFLKHKFKTIGCHQQPRHSQTKNKKTKSFLWCFAINHCNGHLIIMKQKKNIKWILCVFWLKKLPQITWCRNKMEWEEKRNQRPHF